MLEPEHIPLANLPTPLVKLERLGRELGGAQIWIKRDDLTGLELSGNKVRKLEYVAADAIASGCDTLVTEGTCQSNHCRATAAVCARLGLVRCSCFDPRRPAGRKATTCSMCCSERRVARSNGRSSRQSATASLPRYSPSCEP